MNLASMFDKICEAIKDDTAECILTPTGLDSDGYGQVRKNYKMYKAHQVSWIVYNKKHIPIGKLVRHTCDNRACINPRHLLLGTNSDNMKDMVTRRRSAVENNKHAKLNWDKVRDIRNSDKTVDELAKLHGVARKQIIRILRNEQWRDN